SLVAEVDLTEVCFGSMTSELKDYPQVALTAVCLGDLEYAKDRGAKPKKTFALSAGEVAALGATNTFMLHDTFYVAREREKAMRVSNDNDPGRMVSIKGLTKEQLGHLKDHLPTSARVFLANVLEHDWHSYSVDISMPPRIERAVQKLKELGLAKKVRVVNMPDEVPPAHSPFQEETVEPLREKLEVIKSRIIPPGEKFMPETGVPLKTQQDVIDYLLRQLVTTTNLPDLLQFLYRSGIKDYLILGPGDFLPGLIQRQFKGAVLLNQPFGQIV